MLKEKERFHWNVLSFSKFDFPTGHFIFLPVSKLGRMAGSGRGAADGRRGPWGDEERVTEQVTVGLGKVP